MKYKKYPSYKDSGVEWLGEIPNSWNKTKTAYYYSSAMGQTILQEDLEENGRFPVYSATSEDKYFGYINNPRVILDKDDLVIPARGNSIGFVKLVKEASTTTQTTIYCKALTKHNHSKFIYYYMLGNKPNLFYFVQTAIPQITVSEVLNNPLVLPPIQEQQQIANFLDNATSKIDTLIEKQTKLIELLKEKRQAVISHAVTKGINPNVKMKDSGVEWLGEIPKHWNIKRLKHCIKKIKAGPFGSSLKKDVYTKSGYRVYGQEQVIPNNFNIGDYYISEDYFNEMRQYEVKSRDILISCVGSYGKIALFPENAEKGIINPRLILIRLNKIICPEFLEWYLKSSTIITQMSMNTRGGTMDIINISILSELVISLPEIEEQKEIVSYLDDKTTKIDKLIEKANKSIKLLKEKRTALISAAVTGKIDVREMV